MDFWKTKSFKVLNLEWNKTLSDSGFEDHETDSKGERSLKQRASNAYRQANKLERETRIDYYLFLGHLVYSTEFPNELERYIMLRHSEGATIKEIVSEIKETKISRDRKTIRYIIRRWQMTWGIRRWSLHQRNLKK